MLPRSEFLNRPWFSAQYFTDPPEKPYVERSTITFFTSGINSLLFYVMMEADDESKLKGKWITYVFHMTNLSTF